MSGQTEGRQTAASRWVLPGWCAVLALAIMAPLARPGFVLTYDMVTVPEQRLVPDALGLGSGLPRAVPQDAVLALVTSVVPGGVVYRAVLVGVIFAAGLGMGLLVAPAGRPAQLVAAAAYAWNAYVAERLVIGHWTVLIAYAALPWIVRAALAVRRGEQGALVRVLLLVALASVTPTGGILGSAVAVLGVAGRSRLIVLGGCVAVQLPWLVPALLTPTAIGSDPAGAEAFAARADSPLGLVGSVLTLGGIWNADVVPDSRGLVSATVLTVMWAALGIVGARGVARTLGRPAFHVLAALAALGVVVALAGAYGDVLAWAIERVPGAGLLRDGQKFIAWYALALAPAVGLGAARVGRSVARRSRSASAIVVGVAVLLPVLAMPDLAWGVWGRVSPVEYPVSWVQVRDAVRDQPGRGALISLPYQPFRSFPWNEHRTVLDPLPRYAGVETVMPDTLTVGDVRLEGEDPRARVIQRALGSDDPVTGLSGAGVGWLAVAHDTPGEIPDDLLELMVPVVITGELDLYRVPGAPTAWPARPPSGVVIGIDLAVLALVTALALSAFVVRIRASTGKTPGTVPLR